MARPPGAPVALDSKYAIVPGAAGRRVRARGVGLRAVDVVPKNVLMVGVNGEHAMALEVLPVQLPVAIALDNAGTSSHAPVRHLGLDATLRTPGASGEVGAPPPMTKKFPKGRMIANRLVCTGNMLARMESFTRMGWYRAHTPPKITAGVVVVRQQIAHALRPSHQNMPVPYRHRMAPS